jgi:hypothetical protein
MTEAAIDAVITWVDGADPAHAARLADYLESVGGKRPAAAHATRFNDAGEIDYCVASILRFAPWIRTIHIITDRQTPPLVSLLAGTPYAARVRVVDHWEIFAGHEQHLPTFSSCTIETVLWRIPGLADRFIYFNDDFMMVRPVTPEDFFREEKVVLRGEWRATSESRPDKRLKAFLGRWFRGSKPAHAGYHGALEASARLVDFRRRYFQAPHCPHPVLGSTLAEYFSGHPERLENNIRHRLRAPEQFLGYSLADHLALAGGAAIVDNRLRTLRIKASDHGLRKIVRALERAGRDERIAFVCVQSLDMATAGIRATILAWLDRRIGRLSDIVAGTGYHAPQPPTSGARGEP